MVAAMVLVPFLVATAALQGIGLPVSWWWSVIPAGLAFAIFARRTQEKPPAPKHRGSV
jgi:hypothetical protein